MVTLKQALKSKLTKKELSLVPSSFDTIGNIALFTSFPKELKNKEKLISEQLLKQNKNIETVAKKINQFSGKYRLQKIKILAGKKTKETIHKENGIKLKLDIEKTYFSPRTGSERLRIAKLVKNNESILVMFSGVAPFPLVIEKNSNPKEIYAIETNPSANTYAKENLLLNKSKKIKLIKGDVSKELPNLKSKFDRIIMPLPKSADSYLEIALKKLKQKGTIHFYDFSQKKDFPKTSLDKIKKYCKKFKVIKKVLCGQYSPYTYRVCIDFQPL